MRKIIIALAALFAIATQVMAQKYIEVYQNGRVTRSMSSTDIDSVSVTGSDTASRFINFWRADKLDCNFLVNTVDSIKVFRSEDEPLVYLGILGFNQKLYIKPIDVLASSTSSLYNSFVSNLTRKDGTLLYYGVDQALDMLTQYRFTTPLSSVNLITFTDGLDQGSLMMTTVHEDESEYLSYLSQRIASSRVRNLPITAYCLGLRGSDVTNYTQFRANLRQLATSDDKAIEVSSMSGVQNSLKEIADQIISISNYQTIKMRIPGQSNGTHVRFTFDGKTPENSSMYIEGTFNLADRSLREVTYCGLRSTSGSIVKGVQDGIFVTYTFKGLQRTDGNGLIPTGNIRQYNLTKGSTTWQINSEFTPENNTQTTITHSGTAILLVLDCSSSLGSQFSNMQSYAKDFISRVANNTASFSLGASTQVTAVMDENAWAVDVSWDAVKNAEYYMVYRSNYSSSNFTKVADSITVTTWRDESPLSGNNYYRIYAMGHGLTSSSYTTSGVVICEMAAPANVSAFMDRNAWAVNINWDAVAYVESYSVYRSSNSSYGFTKVADNLTVTYWRDNSPLSGNNYYRIYANGHGLTSSAGTTSEVVVCEMAAPANVTAVMDYNNWTVKVSWNAVKYAESYTIFRSNSSSGGFSKVAEGVTTTNWNDEPPINVETYYQVYAVGHGFTSSASQTSNVVLKPICPDKNHPHFIDLGLPSGTLWACCNVDSDPSKQTPVNYGSYFAWGETEEKDSYIDSNSIYYGVPKGNISGTEDDVAHVKWGSTWQLPTNDVIDELINNCSYTVSDQNGIKGMMFTATNGNSIFLPFSGYRYSTSLYKRGNDGSYWSGTSYDNSTNSAYIITVLNDGTAGKYNYNRYDGHTVRPVSFKSLALSLSTIDVYINKMSTVEITAGSGCYEVISSNTDVATVSLSGNTITISGVSIGTAVVTVRDMNTYETKEISVLIKEQDLLICPDEHHPHLINLGLPSGTLWACCNVDTEHPENQSPTNYGGYYAWGETEVKDNYSESTYEFYKNGSYVKLGSDIAGTQYDVAHVKWGGEWKMPTKEQQDELRNNCTYEWTTMNGVNGGKFSGSNGGSIFLPAAGYRWDSELSRAGNFGYFWSSTLGENDENSAYILFFSSSDAGWGNGGRFRGRSVRPVR